MNQTIKESAMNYIPKSAKNITELQSVDVDLVLLKEKGIDIEGNPYEYNYIEQNGEKYRIPDSVQGALKEILKKKPTLKTFAVSKTGEGKLTKYTVIPLE